MASKLCTVDSGRRQGKSVFINLVMSPGLSTNLGREKFVECPLSSIRHRRTKKAKAITRIPHRLLLAGLGPRCRDIVIIKAGGPATSFSHPSACVVRRGCVPSDRWGLPMSRIHFFKCRRGGLLIVCRSDWFCSVWFGISCIIDWYYRFVIKFESA